MYIKIKEFLAIEEKLIKNGFASKGNFTWSGDLGYKELRCYTELYSLGCYIAFRWYEKSGNFECLYDYSHQVGLCGGFKKKANITNFINEIGVGFDWVQKIKKNTEQNTPDHIIF